MSDGRPRSVTNHDHHEMASPAIGLCLVAALGGGFGLLNSAQGADAVQAPGKKPPQKTHGLPEKRPPATERLTVAGPALHRPPIFFATG